MKRATLYVLLMFLFASCQYLSGKKTSRPVARAFDRYLYEEDLDEVVPAGTTAKDSVQIVKAFINNWVWQNVTLYQAEKNVRPDQKYIEKQLENYRNSLIIFSYEQELIRQKLDTTVTEKEIADYYHQNQPDFELKKSIIKAFWVKLSKDAPKKHIAKKWIQSDNEEDLASLELYCNKYAPAYSLRDSSWLYLEELTTIVPVADVDEEHFFRKNNLIELEKGKYIYWLFVKDFMYRNSVSPLAFVEESIRTIIINKRKLKLISDMEKEVFSEATRNGDFEIYDEK